METNMQGTCRDMCPFKERRIREQRGLLHPLEMVPGTERNKRPQADPSATIKEYSRPAAGKDEARPADLRPPDVLATTVEYMIKRILTRFDWPWLKLYHYVFDRLRCVRQDIVIQRLCGKETIMMLEWCVKFHIYAGYRLCTEPGISSDMKFNTDHTQECLKRLLVLYQQDWQHPSRPQFESLYLLYNLGSPEAARHIMTLPESVKCHYSIQLALQICQAYWEGNFIRFWRLYKQCSYIQSCALHRHVIDVRWRALCTLNTAYSSRNLSFPISVLTSWLMFDSDADTVQFCKLCGLEAGLQSVKFLKGNIHNSMPNIPPSHSVQLVDHKLDEEALSSVADIILGLTVDR